MQAEEKLKAEEMATAEVVTEERVKKVCTLRKYTTFYAMIQATHYSRSCGIEPK